MYQLNDEGGGQIGASEEAELRQVEAHARVKTTHLKLQSFMDRHRFTNQICAEALGKPIVVKPGMDRRKVKVPPCYVAVLNTLVAMFGVNDQNEYKLHPELFDEIGVRATSHAELCNMGAARRACGTITESQIDRVLRVFAKAGIIDRWYPYNAVKSKRRLFIQLRSDNVIAAIRRIDAIQKNKVFVAPPTPSVQVARDARSPFKKLNKDGPFLEGGPCINADRLYNLSSKSCSASPVTGKSETSSSVTGDFKDGTVPVQDCPLKESAERFARLVDEVEGTFETLDDKQLARLKRLHTSASPRQRLTLVLFKEYAEQRDMHASKNSPDHDCDLDSFLKWWPGILRNMRAAQIAHRGGWDAEFHLQRLAKLPQEVETMVAAEMLNRQSGQTYLPYHSLDLPLTLAAYLRLGDADGVRRLQTERPVELRRACFDAPAYFDYLCQTVPEFLAATQLPKWDVADIHRRAIRDHKFAINMKAQMEVWAAA